MSRCPKCRTGKKQSKFGKNRCGSQRMQCAICGTTYTPEPKQQGYCEEVREKAVRLYVEGNNFRRIGRLLSVNHQSVVNWVNSYHEKIKDKAVVPPNSKTIEMDELWTFVEKKKTKLISQQQLIEQLIRLSGLLFVRKGLWKSCNLSLILQSKQRTTTRIHF